MKRYLKSIFLRNWPLKLFSLLIALILWFALTPPEKTFQEKTLTIPLEIHNIPAEMELVKKPAATVDVKIRAPKSLIGQITSANVHAVLNLINARIDQEIYPLNESMISIPSGAQVKEVFPSQVTLTLERTKEIMVDVEPQLAGKVKEGFVIESARAFPPQVPIKGPESKVKQGYVVKTGPIDVSGLAQNAEFDCVLILPNPDLRLASQTKVKVTVIIRKETPEDRQRARSKTQKK